MSNFSGADHVLINTRERAVSTDINSLQQRNARSLALARQRAANDRYEWSAGRGKATEEAADANPLAIDVIGGLQVQVFSTHLLVDAGTVGIKATTTAFDGSKDASYLIVNSSGVTSSLILPYNANSDGVDIVEFQVDDLVTVVENRDIYDPLTGLFTASMVTKAAEASLTFRIRQGAGGAGFPGTAAGWTPLVVGVHAVVTATFNDVDFYDVRPMVNERTSNPSRVGVPQSLRLVQQCDWAGQLDSGDFNVSGTFYVPWGAGPDSTDLKGGGYRLHGRIGPTLPGTTNDVSPATLRLVMNDADIWDASDNPVASQTRWAYLVTMQPFNLPRWVRYTTGATRQPGLNMGLYVATIDPTDQIKSSGTLLNVELPPAYRLGVAVDTGRVIACFEQNSGADMTEGHCSGGMFRSGELLQSFAATSSSTAADTLTENFDINGIGGVGALVPGGTIGFEISANFFFDITAAASGTFIWSLEETPGAIPLQRSRLQGFAQYPISTNELYLAQVGFTIPSEESPNVAGLSTGAIGFLRVVLVMAFSSGSGAASPASTSTIRLNGVRLGWA